MCSISSYRGHTITYDEIGNPLSYYNGSSYTFTWKNGRRLATAVKGSNTLSFEYNDDGIRTSKTVYGVEHIYYLNGSQIVAESWNGNFIAYIYDATGSPIGMQYHGSSFDDNEFAYYWYVKNYQGDILAVYSNDGVKLISYSYDAWGNVYTLYSNGGSSTAAKYNPFKYRGYYHDSETGFYYLNSRYYDPATGRFLNADGYISTGTGLLGYNMFAYCNNNPVMHVDHSGQMAITTTSSIIVICLLVVITISVLAIKHNSSPKYVTTPNINIKDLVNIDNSVIHKDDDEDRSYYIYVLYDKDNTVQYVGRTKDPEARKIAHKNSLTRGHLTFEVIHDKLTYKEARALEEMYMLAFQTLDVAKEQSQNNLIHGISLSNPNRPIYFSTIDFVFTNMENRISNTILNWLEGSR